MQQMVHALLGLFIVLWRELDESAVFYPFKRKEEAFLLLLPILGDDGASSSIEPTANLPYSTILSQPAKSFEKYLAGQIIGRVRLADFARDIATDRDEMFPKNCIHECTLLLILLQERVSHSCSPRLCSLWPFYSGEHSRVTVS